MKTIVPVSVLALALFSATSASAAVGVTLKAGTLGVGADLTVGIHERVGARVNFNSFNYSIDVNVDEDSNGGGGGKITPALKLQTIGALLDVHPFAGGFRISAGLYSNKNKLDLTADTSESVEVNNRDYFLSDIGGSVSFKSTAPYVGLGYGNAAGKDGHWHFAFDLGVLFQGSPKVSLHAQANDPRLQKQLDADIAAETLNIEDDIKAFNLWPVLSIGVSYRF